MEPDGDDDRVGHGRGAARLEAGRQVSGEGAPGEPVPEARWCSR